MTDSTSPNPGLPRRRFLGLAGGGVLVSGGATAITGPAMAEPQLRRDPFTCGVASGDPTADGVVLWTRLAPEPLSPDGTGGMSDRTVPVQWQVAADERFDTVVRAGVAMAEAQWGHSVHVELRGLDPARHYWYRFRVGQHLSPIGRTKTAPLPGSQPKSLNLAFASCFSYSHGYFTPLQHMADEDLDFAISLGDFIYANGSWTPERPGQHMPERLHAPNRQCVSLADFRVRYAQYRGDPDMQAAFAAFPWIVTIDDNDILNNWWGQDTDPTRAERHTIGLQAFWENMPLPLSARPRADGGLSLHRRLTWGDMASLFVLDTRQYRHQQTVRCELEERTAEGYCPAQLDPSRTILGDAQERWLTDGLTGSDTSWNLLANQMFFTQRDRDFEPGDRNREFNLDGWDGYVADRQTVLDTIQQRGLTNTVILTGDSHQNWVLNTPPHYSEWGADATPVATEFMVTSVTATPVREFRQLFDPEPDTPHLLYRDNSNGYARVHISPTEMVTTYRAVSTVREPEATISDLTSWAVQRDRAGAEQV